MTSNSDWASFPDDLAPNAANVGPFPQKSFLESVWKHRSDGGADLHIERSHNGAVAVAVSGGRVTMVGDANLTDYHAPLGPGGAAALTKALEHHRGLPFSLDSLPQESADEISTELTKAGIEHVVTTGDSTAVVELPSSYEEWLGSLVKKQRHEVRRKIRRFEAQFGSIEIEHHTSEAAEVFISMHRTSAGDKGTFMTDRMSSYFHDLLDQAGASIHLLVCHGEAKAAAFGFETEDGYYYYNSAFDPHARDASPGIVLLAAMIEVQIGRNVKVFDFLKGAEPYKIRHGAVPRQLYDITGGDHD